MTSASGEQTSLERKSPLTCLFCQAPKPDLEPRDSGPADKKKPQSGWPSDGAAYRVDDLPFFICSRCECMETEKSRFFPNKLEETYSDERCRAAEGEQRLKGKGAPESCSCRACVERKRVETEQAAELEAMYKAWTQLRFAVRTMYREGLTADGQSKTPRTPGAAPRQFHIPQLTLAVKRLCSRDPHQLYTRLEALGVQYVMEVQVNLLEILVSPQNRGLRVEGESLTLEQTRLFLRETLDSFSSFQDTVRHMAAFMADLDEKHLEKFGITWKVVHHHLFDAIVYQNSLIQSALPKMSTILKVDLVAEDGCPGNGCRVPQDELPPAAFELAQSFRALDRLMKTSRLIWQKASQRMQDFADKQMKLYKATLKAKQRMLKEDLEFFKLQRRLLAECVAKGNSSAPKLTSEKDLCDFTDTIRELLTGGRRGARHRENGEGDVACRNCDLPHCPCDECTISHMITCGLVGPEEEGDLGLPHAFLDDMSYVGGSSLHSSDDDGEVEDLMHLHHPNELESALLVRTEKDRLLSMKPSEKLFAETGDGCPKTKSPASSDSDHSDDEPSEWAKMFHDYIAKKKLQHSDIRKDGNVLLEQLMAMRQSDVSLSIQQRVLEMTESQRMSVEIEAGTPQRPSSTDSDGDQDYKFLEELLKSGDVVSLVEPGEGGDAGEITDEMLAFMKEEVANSSAHLSPHILRDMEQLDIPGHHPYLLPKMLEKAVKSGEAAARFQTGKSWTAAMICTSKGSKPELNTTTKLLVSEGVTVESGVDGSGDRTAVIAEARAPNPFPVKRDSVSVATQVEAGLGKDAADPHQHHHHHHAHHLEHPDRNPCAEKGERHCCACCCLEMLGKEGRSGRSSQIVDRLRQKLKKKNDEAEKGGSLGRSSRERERALLSGSPTDHSPQHHPGAVPSVDTLLEFIEGSKTPGSGSRKESKAAAKRQRKRQAAQQRASPLQPKDHHNCQMDPMDTIIVEDVFKPREDLENLNEEDRDVENFKKLLMAAEPVVNRQKIQLNLSGFLKRTQAKLPQ